MHLFLHKHINYGHVTQYTYGRSHICLRSRQLKHLPKLFDFSSNATANAFVFDRKQFSEITIVHEHERVSVVWPEITLAEAKQCGRLLCNNLKLPQSSFFWIFIIDAVLSD